MNSFAAYPAEINVGMAILQAADTSLTSPTTAGAILLTAGANGTRIDAVKVRALGTNDATVLRLFILNTKANAYSLVDEAAIPASTLQSAAPTQSVDKVLLPVNYDGGGAGELPPYLPAGYKLIVSIGTAVAAGLSVTGYGGDY